MTTAFSSPDQSVVAVLNALDRAAILTDLEGRVLAWNAAAEALYGWTAAEADGRTVFDLLVPELGEAESRSIMEQVTAGEAWTGDFTVRRRDGTPLLIEITDSPVRDASGHVVAVLGVAAAAADRQLRTELRMREDELRLALQAGRMGTWRWDMTADKVVWDPELEAVYGIEPGGFGGSFEAWMEMVHPDDREQAAATVQAAVDQRRPYDIEFRIIRPDGELRWVWGRAQIVLDDRGEPVGAIGVAGDMTESRQLLAERDRLLEAEQAARWEAEVIARRLAALQMVTAALSGTTSRIAMAEIAVRQGGAALGATTGSLAAVVPKGAAGPGDPADHSGAGAAGVDAEDEPVELELVTSVGYDPDVAARFARFPLTPTLPAGEALERGEIVFIPSLAERDRRYPALVGTTAHAASFAIIPLTARGGRRLGVLSLGFADERTFDDRDRAYLQALGAAAAQALERTELFAREASARQRTEAASAQLAFLAHASEMLGADLDYRRTLTELAKLAVPRLADWCAVHLVGDDGVPRSIVTAHTDPARAELVQEVQERYPSPPDAPTGLARVIRTGEPEWYPHVPDALLVQAAQDEHHLELLRSIGLGALAIVPITGRSGVVGTLSVANEVGRAMSEDDVSLLQELARRAAAAIENARLYEELAAAAAGLQHSLLPPSLPDVPGLDLGARYAAGGRGLDVGGDFYDVLPLRDGRWLVVIGDVRGRGPEAAGVTGVVRHSLRSAALSGLTDSPAALLRLVNDVLLRDGSDRLEPRFCTMALLAVEPAAGGGVEGVLAIAGHPLPVVRRADGTVERIGQPGTLLGVVEDAAELVLIDAPVRLEPGEVAVLFTDGITDVHNSGAFFGDTGVARAIAERAGDSADALAAAVVEAARRFAPTEPRDDRAVLVLRGLSGR